VTVPSLDLVRAVTDEHVLRALMTHRRLTRSELATATGISKPTAGESVRRLESRGLVVDTGERTPGGRGRGRVGSYYALTGDVGVALAVSIAPSGVVAEAIDVYGAVVARASRAVSRPVRAAQVSAALSAVVTQVLSEAGPESAEPGMAARLAVVSAADPVDRATGRLVRLPDSPFLMGSLDPVHILTPYVRGPVVVDNDVNWAARAEAAGDDFAYLYLGEGLGCAIVAGGEVRRGERGLAGEIAHLIVPGPDGRAVPFIEVFGELGLRQPGSSAIDVPRLLATGSAWGPIARAVSAVAGAVVALSDPAEIRLGGWGASLVDPIAAAVAATSRPVPVRPAGGTDEPALTGARHDALTRLRAAVTSPPGR
jgi:predicted NBD/HSP70 family sugar kinase